MFSDTFKFALKHGLLWRYIFEKKSTKNNLASRYLNYFAEQADHLEILSKDEYTVLFRLDDKVFEVWITNKWYSYASNITYGSYDKVIFIRDNKYHVLTKKITDVKPSVEAICNFYTKVESRIPPRKKYKVFDNPCDL